MALQQAGRGSNEKREQQAFWLGQIESALEGTPGGARVGERVARDRVEQESLNHPKLGVRQGNGAVDDGRQRDDCRFRIVLGEPQRRHRDAHLSAFTLFRVHTGEDLLGVLRFTHPNERLQQM